MYPNMYNRDEIFFRLGIEKSDDLLQKLKNIDNPNYQDTKGISYLHRACQRHYVEAIKILLELGANPNINDNRGFSQHGLDLDKMEGDITLKERIESFKDDEMNKLVQKYYHK